jgi:hypothetical protein
MGFELSKKAARWMLVVASVCFVTTLGMLIHRIVNIPTYVNVAEVVEQHLEAAKQEAAAGLEPQIDVIHQFFAQARLGTRPFAEDALGWGSKWEFINGCIFYDDRHREYLEERFAARVFRADDLEQTVEFVVAAYLKHLDNVDATFMVNLQADLEDIPTSTFSVPIDSSLIQQSMAAAIREAVDACPRAVGVTAVNFAAGEALTQLGLWLGAKAGILTIPEKTTLASFGTEVVVGLVADEIISRAYNEMYDPAGDMSRQVDERLGRLESLILSGYGWGEPGLYQRLRDYAERRAEARKAAINAALSLPGAPSI